MATRKGKVSSRIYLPDSLVFRLEAFPNFNISAAARKGIEEGLKQMEFRQKSIDSIDLTEVAAVYREKEEKARRTETGYFTQEGYEAGKAWVASGKANWQYIKNIANYFEGWGESRLHNEFRQTGHWKNACNVLNGIACRGVTENYRETLGDSELSFYLSRHNENRGRNTEHYIGDWIVGFILAVRDLHSKLKDLVEIDEVEDDKEES